MVAVPDPLRVQAKHLSGFTTAHKELLLIAPHTTTPTNHPVKVCRSVFVVVVMIVAIVVVARMRRLLLLLVNQRSRRILRMWQKSLKLYNKKWDTTADNEIEMRA